MGFVKEFKEFALKGSAIDMAVGIIIGGAFGAIVTSVIDDLIMPIIGAIIGKPDFSSLYWVIRGTVPDGLPLEEARKVAEASVFAYGNFITVLINFLLLALVIFLLVRGINKLRKDDTETPEPTKEETLLSEIRDLLKAKK
ncbi:MAG: large conductance mechanosensitive channel protein MscL [Bacteroidales bacterium]|nr:large conductance mechanosensitive channel protein MscL [Bacteroidales bacterium]